MRWQNRWQYPLPLRQVRPDRETPSTLTLVATTALPRPRASISFIFSPEPASNGEMTTPARRYSGSRSSTAPRKRTPSGLEGNCCPTRPATSSRQSGSSRLTSLHTSPRNQRMPTTLGAVLLPTNSTERLSPGCGAFTVAVAIGARMTRWRGRRSETKRASFAWMATTASALPRSESSVGFVDRRDRVRRHQAGELPRPAAEQIVHDDEAAQPSDTWHRGSPGRRTRNPRSPLGWSEGHAAPRTAAPPSTMARRRHRARA